MNLPGGTEREKEKGEKKEIDRPGEGEKSTERLCLFTSASF